MCPEVSRSLSPTLNNRSAKYTYVHFCFLKLACKNLFQVLLSFTATEPGPWVNLFPYRPDVIFAANKAAGILLGPGNWAGPILAAGGRVSIHCKTYP